MKKKILYFIPTIILVLYLIISLPLFKYISDIYSAKGMFPSDANDTMFKIDILMITITTIMKILFKGSKCNIKRTLDFLNIIIFIFLCLTIILFGGIFRWA